MIANDFAPMVRVGSYVRLSDEILRIERRGRRIRVRTVNAPIPRESRSGRGSRLAWGGRSLQYERVAS